MPSFETILYEKKGKIVYVTLNRPQILNALNDTMAKELNDAWFEFDADPEAQVAILSGSGRAFCSGADVKQRQLRSREELIRLGGPAGRGTSGGGLGQTVNWKPVIGAVHGYAYGAGYHMAMGCDLLVVAAGTQLQFTELRRGISGASGWVMTWFMTGDRFANEVAITGRAVSAEEAHEHGMVNRVVPPDQIMSTAEELAEEIMKEPTRWRWRFGPRFERRYWGRTCSWRNIVGGRPRRVSRVRASQKLDRWPSPSSAWRPKRIV